MLKGRLLRQEAINLEGDQKTGNISDEIETGYVDLNAGKDSESCIYKDLTVRNNAIDPGAIGSKPLKDSAIRLPDLETHAQGHGHKLQKRVIFSKRIHSSPTISKHNIVNIAHRAKRADEVGLERRQIDKESSIGIEQDTRTLEEAVHEFLLQCHNRRSGDVVSVEKRDTQRKINLNERICFPETGNTINKEILLSIQLKR